jgi:hypothetical protein
VHLGKIVREELVQESAGLGTLHVHLAHVADIEEASRAAHGAVFVKDAAVLHGHLPAGEVDQPAAVGGMKITQGRPLEFAHRRQLRRSAK